ncbi:copper resistance protein CopC [Corynebacterium felinum]|uniref:Methionine-rich copper-binding protein CopC n=1 Tax=Corynebacterium felinum TaxID=131318 RepID=A0ABU2BC20_9CORY|nr:copper resistance CopC family protein [Corynebacterium felinum]MDF5821374.1 copper resistance protein CopC [Corynebacterium felinum]MDR7355826.1 methionine-rich copper-binding protein CopC [Corynebacterium felinum]WJY95171.1 hypothetical protein CFELI_07785 [Corynebacterium felinum]
MQRKTLKQRLAASSLAAGLTLAGATTFSIASQHNHAWAHDAVVGGKPFDGETLETMPDTLVLEFSGEPKNGFNTMAVSDANKNVLFSGEPTVEGRNISIKVPDNIEFPPGEYTIGFQITSSDGHSTRGKTNFFISDSAQQTPTPTTKNTPAETTAQTGDPVIDGITAAGFGGVWLWVAAAIGVCALIALAVMTIMRNKK